jgi:paraquat-inducible protein B
MQWSRKMELETGPQPQTDDALPAAVVRTQSRVSIVWLIPLVAALLGAYLAYQAISSRGPTIYISFKSGEGLVPGKTKIRYKDVDLGDVLSVQLSDDVSHVIVTAQMTQDAERFLKGGTRFWVVRARVAAGEVSGLGTLFSGAYIGMDPAHDGSNARSFIGLEAPPVVANEDPGKHFVLEAANLGSLDVGSPVYFRKIKVGEVESYTLAADGSQVNAQIFVRAPFDRHVRSNTQFWNASGVDLSLDASGVRVDTESLVTLLIGGIAFDTPASLAAGTVAQEGSQFRLYESHESTRERYYSARSYWLLHFEGSIRGLAVGAPVEFRGMKLGQVVDVRMQYDPATRSFRIPVLIEIETERLGIGAADGQAPERRELLDGLVAQGLRAQLKTGSLVTGQLYVDFDIHTEAPPANVVWSEPYPELPSVPTPLQQLAVNLTRLVEKFDRLPVDKITADLADAVAAVKRLTNSPELHRAIASLNEMLSNTAQSAAKFNDSIAPSVETTLEQSDRTLVELQRVLREGSPAQQDLHNALKEVAQAARSLRLMADFIERHPDALLKGKQGP